MKELRLQSLPVYEIDLPLPKMGSKIFCATKQGMYILEKGPVVWRAMCNTHIGTGTVAVYDGVCDDNGFFQTAEKDEFLGINHNTHKNGRRLFYANPSLLGMWMFDGYCHFGLTLAMLGDFNISPSVTMTWMPYREPKRNIS